MLQVLDVAKIDVIKQVKTALSKTDEDEKRKADKIADALDLSSLDGISEIEPYLADVAYDSGERLIVQVLDNEQIVNRVNPQAVKYAKERGAELIRGVDEATRNEIATTISKGLADNIGMDAIAKQIEQQYTFSEDRARLIAQTEIAMANQSGVLIGMKELKDLDFDIKKVWLPDAIACPICVANGDDGPIELEEMFSGGALFPPQHPRCRCTMASEITEE